ncbi:MAG: hypothetical protein M1837_002561 [Sclerophora amabilis]|nr:MAG: hypothetical protein M1837_002561 [Sclerophora amabilis]
MRNDGLDASLKFAAYWTSHSLAPLSENEHFTYNSLIHVTYDVRANYSESNSIGSIPFRLGGAVPVATTDDAFYKLYSIPFTLENTWRLPRLGRFHVETNVFDAAANFSGYEKHAVDQSDTDLSLSYLGPLDGEIPRRFAPQNPYTIGAGDERMLKSIAATWAPNGESDSTYYDGSGNLDDGDDLPLYKKKSPSTSQRSEGGVMGMPAAGISMVLVGFLFVVFA